MSESSRRRRLLKEFRASPEAIKRYWENNPQHPCRIEPIWLLPERTRQVWSNRHIPLISLFTGRAEVNGRILDGAFIAAPVLSAYVLGRLNALWGNSMSHMSALTVMRQPYYLEELNHLMTVMAVHVKQFLAQLPQPMRNVFHVQDDDVSVVGEDSAGLPNGARTPLPFMPYNT